MGARSGIEWTDASWTPIRARHRETGKVGWHCEHATTGCVNCYSEAMNKRLGTGLPFKPGHRKDIELFLDDKMLLAPLHWRKPRMIFVCSMTDLFADFVPDQWIDLVFAVMALSPQHTFQVLTKRAERMREYLACKRAAARWVFEACQVAKIKDCYDMASPDTAAGWQCDGLPNVWLGVSAERQEEADERIPHLLQTPAAIRFVSCEPLIGPIDLTKVRHQLAGESFMISSALQGDDGFGLNAARNRLDWVIVGGESGKDARPMHPDWARALRDQCAAAGVAFFFKQWGSHEAIVAAEGGFDGYSGNADLLRDAARRCTVLWPDGRTVRPENSIEWWEQEFDANDDADTVRLTRCALVMARVAKKAAGRILDGQSHNDMPGRVG